MPMLLVMKIPMLVMIMMTIATITMMIGMKTISKGGKRVWSCANAACDDKD